MIDISVQARKVALMLMKKGYGEKFSIKESIPVSLEEGLPFFVHLRRIYPPEKCIFPLPVALGMYSYKANRALRCVFEVGFCEESGFTLEKLRLGNYPSFLIFSTELVITPGSWEFVPSFQELDEISGLQLMPIRYSFSQTRRLNRKNEPTCPI